MKFTVEDKDDKLPLLDVLTAKEAGRLLTVV